MCKKLPLDAVVIGAMAKFVENFSTLFVPTDSETDSEDIDNGKLLPVGIVTNFAKMLEYTK